MNLKGFIPQMRQCSACGQCLEVCPVYLKSRLETDSPRGKLAIAYSLAEDRLDSTAAANALARCTLCGRCTQKCPQSLPLENIFFAARASLGKTLPARYKQLARAVTGMPKVWDFCQPPIHLLQGLLKTPIPSVAFKTFRRPDLDKGNVLLFSGCLARRFFPELIEDSVKALTVSGFSVLWIPEQVCCGRPLAFQGSSIAHAIRRNLRLFAELDFNWIASPCPGCLMTIKQLWTAQSDLDTEEKALIARFSSVCIDINVLLVRAGATNKETSYFWHSPCLLEEEEKIAARKLAGIKTAASEVPSCCGAPLNLVAITQENMRTKKLIAPPQSSLQSQLKKSILTQTGRERQIATACPGCMLALRDMCEVRHSIQIYSTSL